MGGIINDWEAVRRFRNELLDCVEDLETQLKRTEQAMEEVAQNWDDIQFDKFNEEFSEDKDKLKPLCDDIKEFEDDPLRRLEDILRRYTEMDI